MNIFDRSPPQFVVPKDHNYMRYSSYIETRYCHHGKSANYFKSDSYTINTQVPSLD